MVVSKYYKEYVLTEQAFVKDRYDHFLVRKLLSNEVKIVNFGTICAR